MAKDIYDKLKIIPELIKTYWAIIIMCGGLSTGGWQWWDKQDVIIEAKQKSNKAVHEVTVAFQNVMIEMEPKEIIVKSTCGNCGNYLNQHIKEFH